MRLKELEIEGYKQKLEEIEAEREEAKRSMRFGNDNNTDSEKQKSFATAENIELCSSSRKEKT